MIRWVFVDSPMAVVVTSEHEPGCANKTPPSTGFAVLPLAEINRLRWKESGRLLAIENLTQLKVFSCSHSLEICTQHNVFFFKPLFWEPLFLRLPWIRADRLEKLVLDTEGKLRWNIRPVTPRPRISVCVCEQERKREGERERESEKRDRKSQTVGRWGFGGGGGPRKTKKKKNDFQEC